MKVGTDGVLLGAWANVKEAGHILDLGCGSGLISLMVAQRNPNALITGVEIDPAAAGDAQSNATSSPFKERIKVVCADILHFPSPEEPFDCIVSNPPYHEEELLPPSATRAAARHTSGGGLTFTALLRTVSRLLPQGHPSARFCVILPTPALTRFLPLAAIHGLHLTHRTHVVTRPGKPCKRTLLEFQTVTAPYIEDELVLVNENGGRSEAYNALCNGFYL